MAQIKTIRDAEGNPTAPRTFVEAITDESGVPLEDYIKGSAILLWGNPDSTVAFPAQTILTSQQTAGYKALIIKVRDENKDHNVASGFLPVYNLQYASVVVFATNNNASHFTRRQFTLASDGLSCTSGAMTYRGYEYEGSPTYCIPTEIYGIK